MRILVFYMAFFVIGSILGCQCTNYPYNLEKEYYCWSNFVIGGRAIGVYIPEEFSEPISYKIEVDEIFKAPSNVKVGDTLTGVTGRTSCGGFLQLGTETVIAGILNDTTFRFWTCSYKKPLNRLNEDEEKLLKNGIEC